MPRYYRVQKSALSKKNFPFFQSKNIFYALLLLTNLLEFLLARNAYCYSFIRCRTKWIQTNVWTTLRKLFTLLNVHMFAYKIGLYEIRALCTSTIRWFICFELFLLNKYLLASTFTKVPRMHYLWYVLLKT